MDENTRGMIDAYTNPVDFTDRKNIREIVSLVKVMDI